MKLISLLKNIKFEILIVLLFVLSRLPALGHDNFNTDVWKWKSRSYDFGTGVFTFQYEKTLQMYHPGVTLMWLGALGVKTYNAYYDVFYKHVPLENDINTIFGLDLVQKLWVVSAIAISLAFVFYVLRKLFGFKYSVLAILLLSFEPFYLALTRVIHLEGLMSTFMLASAVWLFFYLQEQKKSRLVVSGVFAGLAILTKTTAFYLLPFVGLVSLIYAYKDSKNVVKVAKSVLKTLGVWMGCLIVTMIVLWPALWTDPVGVFNKINKGISVVGIDGEHAQFYFSKYVQDPGITFYPVVLGLRSSIWLLLGLVGLLALVILRKGSLESKRKEFITFLLIYSFFYLIEIIIPTKKLDRYVMPIIMSLSLVSSFFYLWFLEQVKFPKVIKCLVLVVPVLYTTFYLHPDYLSYYNPMFGGLKAGINIIEPKWLIGAREIESYFKNVQKQENFVLAPKDKSLEALISTNKAKDVLIVGFQEKYYTQIWPFFREFQAWAVIEGITAQSEYAQYFVYPVWDDTSSQDTRFDYKFVDTIKIRGVPVYNVYKSI